MTPSDATSSEPRDAAPNPAASAAVIAALARAAESRERHLAELFEFLRIPSVSALPRHAADVRAAAEFVAAQMTAIGLDGVRLVRGGEGAGHPLVYGEWLRAPGAPTLLCYGHYDVQPADPFEEWLSPPFSPALRDGRVYARGAADDKGQIFAHLKALEAWLRGGGLPLNARVLIEGEEETGGAAIAAYVRERAADLACDAVLISDTTLFAPGLPTLAVGLRGLLYAEIHARGAQSDLHSGLFGGVAPNPLHALAAALTALKGADGRVALPGFYDAVRPPAPAELAAWRRLPFDEEEFRRDQVRASALPGEPGRGALERVWARPTFEVHGIVGGFTGTGAKTVIPAHASAKVSFRLVPDQRPEEVFAALERRVRELAPPGVTLSAELLSTAAPIVVDPQNHFVRAAERALAAEYGRAPVLVRSGGSIPIVDLFASALRAPAVMMGFATPDCGAHAPNESFPLVNFHHAVDAVIRFFAAAASR